MSNLFSSSALFPLSKTPEKPLFSLAANLRRLRPPPPLLCAPFGRPEFVSPPCDPCPRQIVHAARLVYSAPPPDRVVPAELPRLFQARAQFVRPFRHTLAIHARFRLPPDRPDQFVVVRLIRHLTHRALLPTSPIIARRRRKVRTLSPTSPIIARRRRKVRTLFNRVINRGCQLGTLARHTY